MSLRKKTYKILERSSEDSQDNISNFFDYFLMALIALNVTAAIIETLTYFKQFKTYFRYFEIFSVIIFTVEYFLRIWARAEEPKPEFIKKDVSTTRKRIRYIFSPMAIIDLLAILPFYLSFIFPIDLRFLRVLRILRIFKLTRYSQSMSLLLYVLRRESRSLASSFFVLLVITVIAASSIYLLENKVQPDVFSSIPATMWWAIVTLTTVGYGDAFPITPEGKMFASLIMIAGIGLVALPTAILASSFSSTLARSRDKLTAELYKMLEDDDHIDEYEAKDLEILRKKLGLSEQELYELKQSAVEKNNERIASDAKKKKCFCPHCGEKLE